MSKIRWHLASSYNRSDGYKEWEFRNRKRISHSPDGIPVVNWCAVLIRTKPFADTLEFGEFKNRLGNVASSIEASSFVDNWSLSMAESALGVYMPRGEMLGFSSEKSNMDEETFLVYMPENDIYEGGEYKESSLYKIIYASPPVERTFSAIGRRVAASVAVHNASARLAVEELDANAVIMGVIDHRIGYANERFCRRKGSGRYESRVRAIWIQSNGDDGDDGDGGVQRSGIVLTKSEIDHALAKSVGRFGCVDDGFVYRETLPPSQRCQEPVPSNHLGTHGTHVADVACGFAADDDLGDTRPILAVQLPSDIVADTSGFRLTSYAIEALRALFAWADKLGPQNPLIVNFSFGFNAGPKDGSHPLEVEMNRLITQRRERGAPTFVVMPAGNNFEVPGHAEFKLAKHEMGSVDWQILPDDRTPSFAEIWVDAGDATDQSLGVELSIVPPNGMMPLTKNLAPRQSHCLGDASAPVAIAHIGPVKNSNGSKRAQITLAINATSAAFGGRLVAAGRWKISLKNLGSQEKRADLYVQRDDNLGGAGLGGRQSILDSPNTYTSRPTLGSYRSYDGPIVQSGTISAIATSQEVIAVGAALERSGKQTEFIPAWYTASGVPGGPGPDLSGVVGAHVAESPYSRSQKKGLQPDSTLHLSPYLVSGRLASGANSGCTVAYHGTSIAAPSVARYLADHAPEIRKMVVSQVAPDTITVLERLWPWPSEQSDENRRRLGRTTI